MLGTISLRFGILVIAMSIFGSLGVHETARADDASVTPGSGGGDGTFDNVALVAGTTGLPANGDWSAPSDDGSSQRTHIPLSPMAGLGQIQPDRACGWTTLATSLPLNDPAWAGNSPADGVVKWRSCAVLYPGAPGAPGNLEGRAVDLQFFPNSALAAPPPPPDPAVLALRAYGELRIPQPAIGVVPDREKLAVNLWTWLWIDDPGPLSNTVAAGGVSVTATAVLTSVTWSLGEPATTGDTYEAGVPATLTCEGPGTSPPTGYDWRAKPPCGYMFHWRSLKERTGGTGKWPITATSNWTVTWASNTGVTGTIALNSTANDQFDVEEYRIVLVQGPGG